MPTDRPHQRKGALSNAHVGRAFEAVARDCLAREGVTVTPNFKMRVGINGKTKEHGFDLGSGEPLVVVECKSHTWTEGDKVPSAKMTTWNEAMYYFSLTPRQARRILFVLHSERQTSGESLAGYYIRTYSHLIPDGVEIWEYSESTRSHQIHRQ
jgi:hypothetical protein